MSQARGPLDPTKLLQQIAQDAHKPQVSGSQLKDEIQQLSASVMQDPSFTAAQQATLSASIQQLLPLADAPNHGADWDSDISQIQAELGASLAAPSTSSGTLVQEGADGSVRVPVTGSTPNPSTPAPVAPTPSTPVVTSSSGAPTSLFPSGRPTVDDVKQGEHPDCALISVMQSMAGQQPDAIKNMIHPAENGGYTVDLYLNGKKTSVPVSANQLQANGAKSVNGQEDWATVIEAAVNSRDGDTAQSVQAMAEMLTGKSSSTTGANGSGIADKMQSTLKAGGIVMADTSNMPGGDTSSGQHIYPGHGYSVASVDNGMVTVHNTVGAHTDGDPAITMSIADFQRLFSTVTTA